MKEITKKTWVPKDIYAGLYIIKESSPFGDENLSYARTVIYKVIFSYDFQKKYGLCSCLTDGFCTSIADNIEEMVDYLNSDSIGYRQLTKEEYIKIIRHTNQGFINE